MRWYVRMEKAGEEARVKREANGCSGEKEDRAIGYNVKRYI